jgi:hypothetical protein
MEEDTVKREGQVWCETDTDAGLCVGLVISSQHDDVLDSERHEVLILSSRNERAVGFTQVWHEDERTNSWDTYDGLVRVS